MAKLDYKAMSQSILDNVGGTENLANVNHCATRLRLKLKKRRLLSDRSLKIYSSLLKRCPV